MGPGGLSKHEVMRLPAEVGGPCGACQDTCQEQRAIAMTAAVPKGGGPRFAADSPLEEPRFEPLVPITTETYSEHL